MLRVLQITNCSIKSLFLNQLSATLLFGVGAKSPLSVLHLQSLKRNPAFLWATTKVRSTFVSYYKSPRTFCYLFRYRQPTWKPEEWQEQQELHHDVKKEGRFGCREAPIAGYTAEKGTEEGNYKPGKRANSRTSWVFFSYNYSFSHISCSRFRVVVVTQEFIHEVNVSFARKSAGVESNFVVVERLLEDPVVTPIVPLR